MSGIDRRLARAVSGLGNSSQYASRWAAASSWSERVALEQLVGVAIRYSGMDDIEQLERRAAELASPSEGCGTMQGRRAIPARMASAPTR